MLLEFVPSRGREQLSSQVDVITHIIIRTTRVPEACVYIMQVINNVVVYKKYVVTYMWQSHPQL
jgi:hypothetical protein